MKKYLFLFILFFNTSYSQDWFSCITPTACHVNSLKEYNGKLIIGGFSSKGRYILSYDGASFDTIGIIDDLYPSIWALEVYNNDLYIGGEFSSINGLTVNGIARYNGVNWSSLGTGIILGTSGGQVEALKVFNNILYVGGNFTSANGLAADYIASWDGISWGNVGAGFDNTVSSFGIYNNELYAGGYFYKSGNDTVSGIGKWDGNIWHPLDNGVSVVVGSSSGHWVKSIQEYNGELYVGGYFFNADTINSPMIAKWDGFNWSAPIFSTNMFGTVTCMKIYNQKLFFGGFFQDWLNGLHYVASWDGSSTDILDSGLFATSLFKQVWACEVYNSRIYYGGNINANFQGNVLSEGIIAWDEFATGIQSDNLINNSLIIYPNPSNSYFTINTAQLSSCVLTVKDILGREIQKWNIDKKYFDFGFDLPSGIYIAEVFSEGKRISIKMIKN